MKDIVTQLDDLLASADESLCRPAKPIAGSLIRDKARKKAAVAGQRWIVTGVAGALMVATGIWLWPTQNVSPPVAQSPSKPGVEAEVSPEQIAAEIEQMQRESNLLQQRIRLLNAERRLQRLQHDLEMTRRFTVSAQAIQQSNTTAWSILVRMSDWKQRSITDPERIQLERLVRSFPETTAESVAREMLATNEVSQVLFEKSNEL